MNKKTIFTATASILTLGMLIGCNRTPYIKETLIHDGSWYSYKKSGTIAKNTECKFTATINGDYTFTYFGMSSYEGTAPYFDIGYNDNSKLVNVTAIYKVVGENKTLIGKMDYESNNKVLYKANEFKNGNQIIIECTITQTITSGLWAYVGNQ